MPDARGPARGGDRHSRVRRGPWRIDVTVRRGVTLPVSLARLARAIAHAAEAAGAPSPASIGLVLSDDAELAELNQAYLGEAGPTDVLSFPMAMAGEPVVGPPGRREHLGDLAISVERAVEQAAGGRGGQTGDVHWVAADELCLLVTHGTLHLCGWDHASPDEEAAMRALERRLLAGG